MELGWLLRSLTFVVRVSRSFACGDSGVRVQMWSLWLGMRVGS